MRAGVLLWWPILSSTVMAHPGPSPVARYTVVSESTPVDAPRAAVALGDPLATPVDVQLDSHATTVRDALEHLLAPSGYRLASLEASCPSFATLLAWPLPAMHRRLQRDRLDAALADLIGPTHHVVVDPVHRLVSFELREPYASEMALSGRALRLPALQPLRTFAQTTVAANDSTPRPREQLSDRNSPVGKPIGPIANGTPLHQVADDLWSDYEATRDQLMVGIFRTNPEGFCYRNLNCLLAGAMLDRPEPDDVDRLSPRTARRIIRQQSAVWRRRAQRTVATPKEVRP